MAAFNAARLEGGSKKGKLLTATTLVIDGEVQISHKPVGDELTTGLSANHVHEQIVPMC